MKCNKTKNIEVFIKFYNLNVIWNNNKLSIQRITARLMQEETLVLEFLRERILSATI